MSKAKTKTKSAATVPLLVAIALLAISLFHAISCFSIGWNNTINDHHSFRQSQNAIMADCIAKRPFSFSFDLPVLGKPWAIPTEFPSYDIIVSKCSRYTGLALDQSGRLVCAFFYLMTMIPIYFLLKIRGVSLVNAMLIISILLGSPFYLFWSRTFMPESTVIFFSFSYIACVMWGEKKNSKALLLASSLIGCVAALSKVTTWLPFLALAFVWTMSEYTKWDKKPLFIAKKKELAVRLFFTCGIPFFTGYFWVKYSDFIKLKNPLGINLVSTATQMSQWNYGTIAQKISPDVWSTILARSYTLFGLPLPALVIITLALTAFSITKKRCKEALIMTALFLLAPAVFTNVHYIHDYYMNANGLFLIGAVAFALLALLESSTLRMRVCGWLFVLFILSCEFTGYATLYQPLQEMPNSEILQITDYLQKNTPDDSVLIIVGSDWNPLVPYYSHRRSLMIPDWPSLTEDQVKRALRNLRGEKIGALLVSGASHYPLGKLLEQAKATGLEFPIMQCGQLPLR
jgi:Dolichyl-phosphate-mannose-protein mannosyltransferase